jgi:4-hydroxy-tetrahydrodipicolinate synthase
MAIDPVKKLSDRLYVAMVTPLNEDQTINEKGLRKLLDYFLKAHETTPDLALIVNPEAGEVFTFSAEEQLRVIKIALEVAGGKLPVFTGALHNSTTEMVKICKAAADAGVDGLFLMPPIGSMDIGIAWDASSYPEVWIDQLGAIVEAVPDKPIICHPTASASAAYGIGIPTDATIAILKAFPQIIGWKMTYNYEGHRKVSRAIRALDRHVAILGAAASNFHENLASGDFDGTVTGSFNYALEPMIQHLDAMRANDLAKAREIWTTGGLRDLQEYIYQTWSRLHVRYKVAAWLRGILDTPTMRTPMPPPRKEEVETLYALFSKMDVSLIPRAQVDNYVAALKK